MQNISIRIRSNIKFEKVMQIGAKIQFFLAKNPTPPYGEVD